MKTRALTPPEATLLLQALSSHQRRIRAWPSEVSTDNKIASNLQHFNALLLCDELQRTIRSGFLRVKM